MHFKAPHFRQNIGHKVRVGVAITLFTGAFLLTSGIIARAYSQEKKPKGGDTVLLMQTDSTFKTPATNKVVQKPDISKLRFPEVVPDSVFLSKSEIRFVYAESWAKKEDSEQYKRPFGLSEAQMKLLNKEDVAQVSKMWEDGKKAFVLAVYSKREGITPSNALQKYDENNPVDKKEKDDILRYWEGVKAINKTQFWNPVVK